MKCTYCNTEISPGTGKLYIKKDGTAFRFCSKKCEKNLLKLKRKSTKASWVVKKK